MRAHTQNNCNQYRIKWYLSKNKLLIAKKLRYSVKSLNAKPTSKWTLCRRGNHSTILLQKTKPLKIK